MKKTCSWLTLHCWHLISKPKDLPFPPPPPGWPILWRGPQGVAQQHSALIHPSRTVPLAKPIQWNVALPMRIPFVVRVSFPETGRRKRNGNLLLHVVSTIKAWQAPNARYPPPLQGELCQRPPPPLGWKASTGFLFFTIFLIMGNHYVYVLTRIEIAMRSADASGVQGILRPFCIFVEVWKCHNKAFLALSDFSVRKDVSKCKGFTWPHPDPKQADSNIAWNSKTPWNLQSKETNS